MNKQDKRVAKAKALIYSNSKFFAGMLYKNESVADASIPKFKINGETVHYNPEHVENRDLQQLRSDLYIAAEHNYLRHPERAAKLANRLGDAFDRKTFNRAAGIAAVNDAITNGIDLVDEYQYDSKWKDIPAEKIYKQLMQESENPNPDNSNPDKDGDKGNKGDQGNGGGNQGDDQGNDQGDGDGDGDKKDNDNANKQTTDEYPCHIADIPAGMTPDEMELKNDMDMIRVAMAAKSQGDELPPSIVKEIEVLRETKKSKEEILKKFVAERVRDNYDWGRPNRRHLHSGLYLPRRSSIGVANDIYVFIDTSYSVYYDLVCECVNKTFEFIMEINNKGALPKITAVYISNEVMGHEVLTMGEKPNVNLGGGTKFAPAWDWLIEGKHQPKGIIFFTDGECYGHDRIVGANGEKIAKRFPILWMLTQENEHFRKQVAEFKMGEVYEMKDV